MKSFSFLLILTMSQAYAKLPSTEFCDNYPQEQKRIAQVKKMAGYKKMMSRRRAIFMDA